MRQTNRVISAAYFALGAVQDAFSRRHGAHVLVACMPKSASTSLTNAIGAYPGFRKIALAAAYGDREQELCQIRLSRYNHRGNYVAQQHLRNSDWTQRLIDQYKLSPVVLIRDLPDVVLSFRDHLRRESHESPVAFFTRAHLQQDDAALEESVVRLAMPWYLNFYAGWRREPRAHLVAYEDLVKDPTRSIGDVLRFAGVEPAPSAMSKAMQAFRGPNNRINVGIAGRGRSLSPVAAEALGLLLDQYPEFANDAYFRGMRVTLEAVMAAGAA
jgi:hypothetical protein